MIIAENISEWVADWYDPIYYRSAPDQNPSGPESGTYRIQLGGYYGSPDYVLELSRLPSAQALYYPGYFYGFHCVLSELAWSSFSLIRLIHQQSIFTFMGIFHGILGFSNLPKD